MLTSKQRAALRAMGNGLDTIFQVGKGGIGEETVRQISNALEARELIKGPRVGKQRVYGERGRRCACCRDRGGRGFGDRQPFYAVQAFQNQAKD